MGWSIGAIIMAHGTLPFKPHKPKRDRLDELVDNIISYMVITTGAAEYLSKKKLLSPKLDSKLMIEVQFCGSLLKNMMGITESYIQKMFAHCMENPEYMEEVEKLAEMFVPESTKRFRLYNNADFGSAVKEEEAKKRSMKGIRTGGGLITRR